MSARPRISVVIPTYRRRASLERTLRALLRQTLSPDDYEIIVCIDGCDEETSDAVALFRSSPHLQCIWQPYQGRAAACNAGAQIASGELLLFLDDDMESAQACLDAHSMYHPPDSRRAVLGAVPIQLSASRTPVEQFMEAKFARFLSKLAQANYSPTVRDFFTGNTSLPRDVFFAAGGFDPDFNAYGNEDGELAVRLLEMGVEIVYGSEAMAHQHYEKTFAVLARDSIEKGRTAVLFAAKHPEMRQLLRLDAAAGCSRKWRLCRGTLLRLSDRIPSAPELVIRFVEMIERRRPANLERYYLLALDYFFRLGAEQALRTEGTAEHARRSAVMQS